MPEKINWLRYVAPIVLLSGLIGTAFVAQYRINIVEGQTDVNRVLTAKNAIDVIQNTTKDLLTKKDVDTMKEDIKEIKVAQNKMSEAQHEMSSDMKLLLQRLGHP